MRAIDIYSGVGGWSLGLAMAGITVVRSYERWELANKTNVANNGHEVVQADVRTLDFDSLPKRIDLVVGSPPCTEFSFANRGGNGNLGNGMVDIVRFLEIVDFVKPKFWAMENVPRTAKIIEGELKRGGSLYRFRHLNFNLAILKFEEFGLPQSRRRCIAGNFDFDLLKSYRETTRTMAMREVISALSTKNPIDPIYRIGTSKKALQDHIREEFLDDEETRINRALKVCHPIYNAMQFPDNLDRPARTITATSTRVSRESVIIADPATSRYRRLTVRESATAQGFPITFQFLGSSYGQKIRMVGNAVPPLISFYVGQAMLGKKPRNLISPAEGVARFAPKLITAPRCKMDRRGKLFTQTRRFRFAIPALRLGSGVRFELSNTHMARDLSWGVSLLFGTSTDILQLELNAKLLQKASLQIPRTAMSRVKDVLESLADSIAGFGGHASLQAGWIRSDGFDDCHPFKLLDALDSSAGELIAALSETSLECDMAVRALVRGRRSERKAKLCRNGALVFSGILIGSMTNVLLNPASRNSLGHDAGLVDNHKIDSDGDRELSVKAPSRAMDWY